MKRTRRILFVLLLLAGAIVLVARWYLTSSFVAADIADGIAKLYGGAAEVGGADVGLGSTDLRGLKLFEAGEGRHPWLQADAVTADVSLWDLIGGTAAPTSVRVTGATVTLRFDAAGRLLTRLPARPGGGPFSVDKLPTIRLELSRLVLQREGGAALTLQVPEAELRQEAGKLALSGRLDGAAWGGWALGSDHDVAAKRCTVTLKSDAPVTVTREMLAGLPFVPPSVWAEVQAGGATPAEVALRFDLGGGPFGYRVTLAPQQAEVAVSALELKADGVSGKVVIDDGKVSLRGVAGRTLAGTVALDADLDFTAAVARLDFPRLAVSGVEVARAPKGWGVPRELAGSLHAEGRVTVTLPKDGPAIDGAGRGEVRGARYGDVPLAGPAELELIRARGAKSAALRVKGRIDGEPVKLGRALSLDVPAGVSGRLALELEADLPLDTVGAALTYRVQGQARWSRPGFAGLRLEGLDAPLSYRDGVLRVGPVRGEAVEGMIVAALFPAGDTTVSLWLRGLPLRSLTAEAPGIDGALSADVTLRAPVGRTGEAAAWRGGGRLASERATVHGLEVTDGAADFTLRDGVLTVTGVRARVEGAALLATGEVRLVEPFPYRARARLEGADLAAIRPGLKAEGRVDLAGEVSGTLAPFRLAAAGTATARRLQLDGVPFEGVSARWHAEPARVVVTGLVARVYGGEVRGGGVLPLRPEVAGSLEAVLAGVDLRALLKDMPGVGPEVEGRADARVRAALGPEAPGKPRAVTAALTAAATRLRVAGVAVDGTRLNATYQNDKIDYDAEARALGGLWKLEGILPIHAPRAGEEAGGGRLLVRGARVERLADLLNLRPEQMPLGGATDIELTFRHRGPERVPVGAGRVVVRSLTWDDAEWLPQVQAELRLAEGRVVFRDVSAAAGGGVARGQVGLAWDGSRRSWFTLTLDHVEASRLLAPWPALKGLVQGPVEARLRGTLGKEWSGSGDVVLARGKVAGAEVSEWRVPLRWSLAPGQGRGRVEVSESHAQLTGGRATLQGSFAWGAAPGLEGKIQFVDLDLRELLRDALDGTPLGGGRATGRLEFRGADVRSADDVTASLDAKLSQTQALTFPVLRELAPVLRVPSSAGYQSGEVRARLARGVVRVERLSLEGGPADLYADGTVTLRGRLDLDVRADTANLNLAAAGLRALGLKLPLQGSAPARVLAEANQYVSGRLLRLRVTGTTDNPTVQVVPLSLLVDEALRFFLGRATMGRV